MPADPDVIRKYSKGECEVLRHEVVQDTFLPQVNQNFDVYPILNSVIFMVAQYWDDAGDDEMHLKRLYSNSRNPNITAHLQFLQSIAESENYYTHVSEIDKGLRKKLMEFVPEGENTHTGKYDLSFFRSRWLQNDLAIALFGCFAPEAGHQDQRFHENYAPFIIFRRSEDGPPEYEFIGENVRPWLEGTIGYGDDIYDLYKLETAEAILQSKCLCISEKLENRAKNLNFDITVDMISDNTLSVRQDGKELMQITTDHRQTNKSCDDLLINMISDEIVAPNHYLNTPVMAVEMLENIVASLRKTL